MVSEKAIHPILRKDVPGLRKRIRLYTSNLIKLSLRPKLYTPTSVSHFKVFLIWGMVSQKLTDETVPTGSHTGYGGIPLLLSHLLLPVQKSSR